MGENASLVVYVLSRSPVYMMRCISSTEERVPVVDPLYLLRVSAVLTLSCSSLMSSSQGCGKGTLTFACYRGSDPALTSTPPPPQ